MAQDAKEAEEVARLFPDSTEILQERYECTRELIRKNRFAILAVADLIECQR